MRLQSIFFTIAWLALAPATLMAQSDETPLSPPQSKITTVSAMRVRATPNVTGAEVQRLKLGTVVNAIARSTNQDTIGGKTDYWYRVDLPNSQTGWLFGGLLLDYSTAQRVALVRQIIEARLKAENTDFSDRREIYSLADAGLSEAKDINTRAEFELLKLLALANTAWTFPDNLADKSPYREWLKSHSTQLIRNEFAGGYNLRSDVLWSLETKYHTLPIADRIAWEAAQNPQPSDCEGDPVCDLFVSDGEAKYLELYPNGKHAEEAVKDLNELLGDDVIKTANDKGGDKYAVDQRNDLRKFLAGLRIALSKSSAAGKDELLRKIASVTKL